MCKIVLTENKTLFQNTSSDDFWQMRLDFCVRDDTTFPNVQDFGPGDYCIIKDGVCPPGKYSIFPDHQVPKNHAP